MKPTLRLEKKLWQKGCKYVVGIDEVGRGALAGPIVAAAVVFCPQGFEKIKGIDDSKRLSSVQREKLFALIKENCFCYQVAKVSEKIIDRIGIGQANRMVFEKAIKKLKIKPSFILADGRMNLDNLKIPYQSIVAADKKIFSVAAASIVAKVSRDNFMKRLDKKYPGYQLAKNKGYGTKEHYLGLKKMKPVTCHRQSFRLK